MKLAKYEIEVLKLMLKDHFNDAELKTILTSPIISFEYTGAGYFLQLNNPILPKSRKTISLPVLKGSLGEIEVGFVIYIESSQITIECHSFGHTNPPETIRKMNLSITPFDKGKNANIT